MGGPLTSSQSADECARACVLNTKDRTRICAVRAASLLPESSSKQRSLPALFPEESVSEVSASCEASA
eukprot:6175213-Pleurochrysis_carterae.AAC.1